MIAIDFNFSTGTDSFDSLQIMNYISWVLVTFIIYLDYVLLTLSDQQVHTINGMSIPNPIRLGACITDSNTSTLLHFGGTDGAYTNSTYKYNFTTMEWIEMPAGTIPAKGHGFRGARYKDTYWTFGVGGAFVPDGSIWIYNLTTQSSIQLWYNNTNETQSANANYVPRVPGYTRSGCANYDSDRHVFWVTGGQNPPTGNNYTRIFNMTRYESGDYDNVWQYDIYGIGINGTFWIEKDIAPYYGGCMYDDGSPFVVAGLPGGGPPIREIFR